MSQGWRLPFRKVTDDQVHWIRTCGLPDKEMARILDIPDHTVSEIRIGNSHQSHPTPPNRRRARIVRV